MLSVKERVVEVNDKQHETLDLLSMGFTSKEIAQRCGVSASAIDQRIEKLLIRYQCNDRRELARTYLATKVTSTTETPQLAGNTDQQRNSISERRESILDDCGGSTQGPSAARMSTEPSPEAGFDSAVDGTRLLWLGKHVTWLEVIAMLVLIMQVYEVSR
jgi:DNA-binding CsgD family transcriptional regulator